ncbi:MAG TPA: acyl-[acyl-carrier-protein] thioesterase [Clostridiales bacterium]|nr:acyl-[acyl-carrier-protein] thioesterase [Clostridiales bacterium]
MYTFDSRVRYSEIDTNNQLNIASLVNYFQDCSTFHSEDLNQGVAYLKSKNRVWLLNSWQVTINRLPLLGENITVETWPYDFKAFFGYRNFILKDQNNNVLAAANSIWIYMDTDNMKPVKFNIQDSAYKLEKPYTDMDYSSRKVDVPENLQSQESFIVTKSNIDTNNHVNNAQYIKMAMDYMPSSFNICKFRAEYKKSALLNDVIYPKTVLSDNKLTILLSDEAENTYAIIEFVKDK